MMRMVIPLEYYMSAHAARVAAKHGVSLERGLFDWEWQCALNLGDRDMFPSSCWPTKAYDYCHSTLMRGEFIVYDSITIFRRAVHDCARHNSARRRGCRYRSRNRWDS